MVVAFDSLVDFFLRNKLVILFYLAVVLFIILNRKKFEFQMKIIALYKANWGIRLMDRLASRYRELIKLFGYSSIGIGFAGMLFIVVMLLQGIYILFTRPDSPPAIAPILPGVHVPGVPEALFVPLVQGVIAIFLVAVIHEFAHGVVARAHHIPIKKTGIAIIGPFFAAFVEPDEAELKKKDDVANYSMIAAGPVSNIFLFALLFLLLALVFMPAFGAAYDTPRGISFSSVSEGSPAASAGLQESVVYDRVNNQSVRTVPQFIAAFDAIQPYEEVTISGPQDTRVVVTGAHPANSSRSYLGVNLYDRMEGDDTILFKSLSWILDFVRLTAMLSLGIGLANLLPIGPIDGGRMLQQALHKLKGEQRGNKTLVRISLLLFFIILLLLTPILRETAKAIIGAF